MASNNLVTTSNRDKLEKLLLQMEIPVTDETIFISEGKQPSRWRGLFFTAMALAGMVRIFFSFAGQKDSPQA